MSNPWAGEADLTVDGAPKVMKLTLGALAELETSLGEASLIALIERFEGGGFSGRDLLALLVAGLRGGGWRECSAEMLADADIGGGPVAAAQAAGRLLARTFALPGDGG
jgi:hypothetical protein